MGMACMLELLIDCPELSLPPDSYTYATPIDEVIILCNNSDSGWIMACRNGTWIGNMGSCSGGEILLILINRGRM